MKVLGIGNALVDVLAFIDNDELLENLELPKGSMQLIDEVKKNQLHQEIINKEKHLASGGSASNTIIGLEKMGISTGFIGRVGDDFYGNYYREDLINNNVESHLIVAPDNASGIATTFISKDGQRTFGTFLGAAAGLTAKDLNEDVFKQYGYLYIEGYLVQNYDLIQSAIAIAKKQGLKVILDMASYNVVEAARDFLLEIIPQYVDIVFANEDEAKALLNVNEEEALSILAKQVEIAVVKLGANGSFIQKGDNKMHVPAKQVNCIDTTGAGDLYASGFLYGLLNDKPLEECGRIGTLLAGNVIQVTGPKMDQQKWDKILTQV